MGLEAATYINQLNAAWPIGGVDPVAQGDDHIRMLKSAIQASFPNITGAMTATQAQLNALATFAAPTVDVGMGAPAAGAALTFLRSDALLRLSASITPTWTGNHTFNTVPTISMAAPALRFIETDQAVDAKRWREVVDAGSWRLDVISDSEASFATALQIYRSLVSITSVDFGNATNNPTFRFLGTGGVQNTSGQYLGANGASATCSYAFTSDPNTGIYRAGADDLRLVAGSLDHLKIAGGAVQPLVVTQSIDGAVGAPSYSFASDPNTGIYRIGADNFGLAVGGVNVMDVGPTAIGIPIPTYLQNGAAATPAYAFASDPNTGIYRIAADQLGFSENGTGFRIGFRSIPVSTTSTTLVAEDNGKCVPITANINIPASVFAQGDCVSISNDTAGALSITISAGTLRLAGTATTGTRTLAQRGIATLWFRSGGATPEVYASGAGLS